MTDKPMHRKDRQLSQEEAWQALAQGSHGVLCLVGEDGWPYGVPMNYVLLDGSLYLHCARSGYKLEAIARDERVCFTVVTQARLIPEHITTLYESVMVLGRAHVVEHPHEHDAALAALWVQPRRPPIFPSPEPAAPAANPPAGSPRRSGTSTSPKRAKTPPFSASVPCA